MPSFKMPKIRTMLMVLLALVMTWSAVQYLQRDRESDKPQDYLKVVSSVENPQGKIKELEVSRGNSVTLIYKDEKKDPFTAAYPDERSLSALVREADKQKIPVLVSSGEMSFFRQVMLQFVPMMLFLGILLLVMSRMAGMGKLFGGGKRFEAVDPNDNTVTFDDVAGLGEAREEVKEVVEFLRDHDRFTRLGARVPRGVLFVGPPGTGKTLLAKAVAGESEAQFFSLTGSDFVEMFAGLGSARVRKLFQNARENTPSIIFIDEIDAIGRKRTASGMGGNDEREQTLNQLLSEMDGFRDDDAVVVIAATNRPDVLDPALMRPGRFDRQIMVDPPDHRGRLDILRVHAEGKPIREEELLSVARSTPGFTGAQLANLLNEAAILAARRRLDRIDQSCLDDAMLRVVAGLETRRALSEEERERIAYHEVGHALCAHFTKHSTPVQKISMVSRGRALGLTLSSPEQDRLLETRESLMDQLVMLLGGRAAEQHIFGSVSSGASNDLERATAIASQMVTHLGLSEKIGPRVINVADDSYVRGPGVSGVLQCSPETAQMVENEVLDILNTAQQQALELIQAHAEDLEVVTAALKENETIEAGHFLRLIGDEDAPSPPSEE